LADLAIGHVGVPPTDRWGANETLVAQRFAAAHRLPEPGAAMRPIRLAARAAR